MDSFSHSWRDASDTAVPRTNNKTSWRAAAIFGGQSSCWRGSWLSPGSSVPTITVPFIIFISFDSRSFDVHSAHLSLKRQHQLSIITLQTRNESAVTVGSVNMCTCYLMCVQMFILSKTAKCFHVILCPLKSWSLVEDGYRRFLLSSQFSSTKLGQYLQINSQITDLI